MLKLLACLALVTACVLPAAPAHAGDAGSGYCCTNACPLAKKANELRANGTEALVASEATRRDLTAEVLAHLKRV